MRLSSRPKSEDSEWLAAPALCPRLLKYQIAKDPLCKRLPGELTAEFALREGLTMDRLNLMLKADEEWYEAERKRREERKKRALDRDISVGAISTASEGE